MNTYECMYIPSDSTYVNTHACIHTYIHTYHRHHADAAIRHGRILRQSLVFVSFVPTCTQHEGIFVCFKSRFFGFYIYPTFLYAHACIFMIFMQLCASDWIQSRMHAHLLIASIDVLDVLDAYMCVYFIFVCVYSHMCVCV